MQRLSLLILPLAILSLLTGLLTGLLRIGWAIPMTAGAGQHGALMVGSFLGALIALERAVVFKNRRTLLIPALNGLSLPAFLLGMPQWGHALLLAGGLGLCGMTYLFLSRYKFSYYYLLFGGSVCLQIGHILLLKTGFYPLAVPWWMAFLLLTIVGERLEINRFLPLKQSQRNLLWVAVGLYLVGVAQPFHGFGQSLAGAGMVGVALWLVRYDMAFKAVRKAGQPRFSGSLLLVGYGWLLVSGLFFVVPVRNAFWYDAALHSFFLGFVFSMIFAHAPIILPGVLGRTGVLFHPALYVWSLLSSLALALRLVGDSLAWPGMRSGSGLMQTVALVGFFLTVAAVLFRQKKPLIA